jgi:hypothetical protein
MPMATMLNTKLKFAALTPLTLALQPGTQGMRMPLPRDCNAVLDQPIPHVSARTRV